MRFWLLGLVILGGCRGRSQVPYSVDPYVAKSIPRDRALEVVRKTLNSHSTRGKATEIGDSVELEQLEIRSDGYSYHLRSAGLIVPAADVRVNFSDIARIGISVYSDHNPRDPVYFLWIESRDGSSSWLRFAGQWLGNQYFPGNDADLRSTAECMYDALWSLRTKE